MTRHPVSVNPAARMAAILKMLRRAPEQLLPSQAFWDAIPDYGGGASSGRRKYRHDIAALVDRGLVYSDISHPRTPNRAGVQLRFLGKPTDWELTAREHAAVRAAAGRHRRAAPP